ncbi:MAG: HAD family phosphatase [Anaerolineae bacterium]|nr:HAD family phosphatase [Anaerolineae bacterium]
MANTNDVAIVFDFGNVLIRWDPRLIYMKLLNNDVAAVEAFLTEVGFMEWNNQQDAGRTFAEGIAELSGKFPHHAALIRAYGERYEESLPGPVHGTVDILYALKRAGHTLYGLTNWPEEKFPVARAKYKFLDCFADIVVSGQVKLVKPDPRIFALLLAKIGRPAGQCLFIDDSAHNIETASKLGFQTIHFKSPEQLATTLRQLGLLHEESVGGKSQAAAQ